jgi:hypothetical protein
VYLASSLSENGARRAGRVLGNKSRYHIATIGGSGKTNKNGGAVRKKKKLGPSVIKK